MWLQLPTITGHPPNPPGQQGSRLGWPRHWLVWSWLWLVPLLMVWRPVSGTVQVALTWLLHMLYSRVHSVFPCLSFFLTTNDSGQFKYSTVIEKGGRKMAPPYGLLLKMTHISLCKVRQKTKKDDNVGKYGRYWKQSTGQDSRCSPF